MQHTIPNLFCEGKRLYTLLRFRPGAGHQQCVCKLLKGRGCAGQARHVPCALLGLLMPPPPPLPWPQFCRMCSEWRGLPVVPPEDSVELLRQRASAAAPELHLPASVWSVLGGNLPFKLWVSSLGHARD